MKKMRVLYLWMLLISSTLAIPLDALNNSRQVSDKNRKIVFHLAYDASSIEKIFTLPERVMEDIPAFWESEDAYRLMKSWHRYNSIPLDFEEWGKKIENIALISPDKRRFYPIYKLAGNIIGAKEIFAEKAIPHICSFLPEKDLQIDSTVHFAAFIHSHGIGVDDRIVIDIFSSYYHGRLSMILNTLVHELYHIGFAHVQYARTDLELENTAINRMLGDVQSEGITTYVAYKAQKIFPAPHERDYSVIENNKEVFRLLNRLNRLFKEAESVPAGLLEKKSWNLGIENRAYSVVGAHMARIIDEKGGREALNTTVLNGPISFIRTYNDLVGKNWRIYEPNVPVDRSIFERLRQAAVKQDDDKYEELLAELKGKMREMDRTKEEKLLRIGLVFMQQKRNDLAIDILRWNAEMPPESGTAYNLLGRAYKQNGNDKLALESFRKSVAIDPDHVDAVENLKKLLEDDE